MAKEKVNYQEVYDLYQLCCETKDLRNHSIFRLDTHRNPAYLCGITNY
ncbi:hypothetical protein [Bacteroides acidifaciens]|nr:hypothetical protein [Bacteroides acidifaciens]MBF0731271.1 hypothetical protein [Bacteroides acidifaciens]MBF0836324.1 hypothetical protein [Bacteroides acidifaciens]MBF0836325.1 hypothetical protein [Bacteroides acidifaciens]